MITSAVQGPLVIISSSCSPEEDEKSIADWLTMSSVRDPVLLIDKGDEPEVEVMVVLKLMLELI